MLLADVERTRRFNGPASGGVTSVRFIMIAEGLLATRASQFLGNGGNAPPWRTAGRSELGDA